MIPRCLLALLALSGGLFLWPAHATIDGDMFAQAPRKYWGMKFKGKLTVQVLSPAAVVRACGGDRHTVACAITTEERGRIVQCDVYMPNNLSRARYRQIYRHEVTGHCNGWPATHPNPVWERLKA